MECFCMCLKCVCYMCGGFLFCSVVSFCIEYVWVCVLYVFLCGICVVYVVCVWFMWFQFVLCMCYIFHARVVFLVYV